MVGTPWSGVALPWPWTLLAVATIAYCVAGEPLLGQWQHRTFVSRVRRDPGARSRFYRRLLALEVALAVGSLAIVAVTPGLSTTQIGLILPNLQADDVGTAVSLGVVIGILPAIAASVLVQRRRKAAVLGGEGVNLMLPRTGLERAWWLGVSLGAGVGEELLFRGVLLALLAGFLPGAPAFVIVIAGGLCFGLAHAYQGWAGVAITALVGCGLGGLYAATGSLLLPIVLHAVLDARGALLSKANLGQA